MLYFFCNTSMVSLSSGKFYLRDIQNHLLCQWVRILCEWVCYGAHNGLDQRPFHSLMADLYQNLLSDKKRCQLSLLHQYHVVSIMRHLLLYVCYTVLQFLFICVFFLSDMTFTFFFFLKEGCVICECHS